MKYFLLLALFTFLSVNAELPYVKGAKESDFHGYKRYDFRLGKRKCYVIEPKKNAEGKPWVWRARFDSRSNSDFDLAMLAEGYNVAQVGVGGLLGGPQAMQSFDEFHTYLTEKCGFGKCPVLEGLSRGGLPIFNWSIQNPDKVSCVYADNAVSDFKSWPGGKGKGKYSEKLWKAVQKNYGFKSEQEALDYQKNPVDLVHILAENDVRVMLGLAMKDAVVPAEENCLIIEKRYNTALKYVGTKVLVLKKENAGHHPHGFKDPSPLVEFAKKAVADLSR
ncbi:MAG: hypothetical protein MK132_27355 [Lentisphaerales bacterium]|nr:hypothetical protein [Lentisphaerales bacterium]